MNLKDAKSWTPLHWASEMGHKECVIALVSANADVNTRYLRNFVLFEQAIYCPFYYFFRKHYSILDLAQINVPLLFSTKKLRFYKI